MSPVKHVLPLVRTVLKRQYHVCEGDHLLAAVSGGADSVCMLLVLHALSPMMRFSLTCVHVHHGIRGAEADRDEAFVSALCEEKEIPFCAKHVDAKAHAAANRHMSLEEAARMLRYGALKEAAASLRAESGAAGTERKVLICTAHHAGDDAETVLLHLIRGTGIRGLAGIRPEREAGIIRPLLRLSRQDIEAYLSDMHASFVTDTSNSDTRFARNAVRLILLPAAEDICPGAAVHIAQTASDMRTLMTFVDKQTTEAYKRCLSEEKEGEITFSVKALRKEEPFLQQEVIRAALLKVCAESSFSRTNIGDILALLHGTNGNASLSLPKGVLAKRLHDSLTLSA